MGAGDFGLILLAHVAPGAAGAAEVAALPRELLGWEWRADVVLVAGAAALLYGRGWQALRRHGAGRVATGWRLAAYLGGLLALVAALLSPLDRLQPYLFFVHMTQHGVLMGVAAPLLLLGRPLPIALRGVPGRGARRRLGRWLGGGSAARRWAGWVARPGAAFLLSTAVLWAWHIPAAYNAALEAQWLHDLEHITFFGAFVLFWSRVLGAPGAGARGTPEGRLAYLVAGGVQGSILGGLITLSDRVLYSHYLHVPRLFGMTALTDQRLSGAIMWIFGTLVYALAVGLSIREEDAADAGVGLPVADKAARVS